MYGGRISEALAADPGIQCIVAGRNPPAGRRAKHGRVSYMALDAASVSALRTTLPGMFAVVNVCGPFDGQRHTVAEQCAELGVHYLDLADSREYVTGFARLNEKARRTGALLVTGAGFAPAVSSALVDSVGHEFDQINDIHVLMSPGNKSPRGDAALRVLLEQAGSLMRIKEDGRWHEVYGWGKPQRVNFPRPVGRRRLYQCDAPELDIFPQRYGVRTATFYTGFELNTFNFGLSLLAWFKRRRKSAGIAGLAGPLRFAAKWFKGRGGACDGYGVVITGVANDSAMTHAIYLIARDGNGAMIPCSASIALVRKWVHQGVSGSGATVCLDMLTLEDIKTTLLDYDIVLIRA